MRQRIGRREDVVGVEDPDHIARRHRDPLVDGVVHPPVALAYPAHAALELWLILLQQPNGAILAAAIDDNVLQINTLLRENAIKRCRQCPCAVVASRY